MSGTADAMLFKWDVHFAKGEGQETPDCYLKIWDGEWLLGQYMMAAETLDNVAIYTFSRTLREGTEYSFQMVTLDDTTLTTAEGSLEGRDAKCCGGRALAMPPQLNGYLTTAEGFISKAKNHESANNHSDCLSCIRSDCIGPRGVVLADVSA